MFVVFMGGINSKLCSHVLVILKVKQKLLNLRAFFTTISKNIYAYDFPLCWHKLGVINSKENFVLMFL